jgi:hypothetical protein
VAKKVERYYISAMSDQPPTPQAIAHRGNAIYGHKYKAVFEPKWRGRFAAIDIDSEQAYVADYPEEALSEAKRVAPNGVFYLVKIGSVGAFKTGRRVLPNANSRLL